MIECKDGKMSIEGGFSEIMAELTRIISGVEVAVAKNTDAEFAREMVDNAVRLSRMNPSEVHEETKKLRRERCEDVSDSFVDSLMKVVDEVMKRRK